MVLLIPEGVVFLLCGVLQHVRECVSSKRQGLLKAAEGVGKALLAVANLCLLYYTNAAISEDLKQVLLLIVSEIRVVASGDFITPCSERY